MDEFESLLCRTESSKVIDASIQYRHYVALDLSVTNPALTEAVLENAGKFDDFVNGYLEQNNAAVAYGGYNEERNLYRRSHLFSGIETEERNIHIGLDIWVKAGTPVLAALDGKVHSFNFNAGFGNYGPTIILQHEVEGIIFHTLYGHLATESISELEVGQSFKKGQQLAVLGTEAVNGNYAPHLHFQIIRGMEGNTGDYPGVCSKTERDRYLKNCPDPDLLLKITTQP